MLATLVDAPFHSPDWVFETKWGGFRMVAGIENRSVTLYSRSGLIVSDNYRPIAKAVEKGLPTRRGLSPAVRCGRLLFQPTRRCWLGRRQQDRWAEM